MLALDPQGPVLSGAETQLASRNLLEAAAPVCCPVDSVLAVGGEIHGGDRTSGGTVTSAEAKDHSHKFSESGSKHTIPIIAPTSRPTSVLSTSVTSSPVCCPPVCCQKSAMRVSCHVHMFPANCYGIAMHKSIQSVLTVTTSSFLPCLHVRS